MRRSSTPSSETSIGRQSLPWGRRASDWDLPSVFKAPEYSEQFLDTFHSEIAILDAQGKLIVANRLWQQRSNAPAVASGTDCKNQRVSLDFLTNDLPKRESIRAKLAAILSGGLDEAEIDIRSRSGGNAKRYHLHMAAVDRRAEKYVVLILDDVTETYALHRDKRLLTDQLMRSEERERGRIAREMHDSTVQDLVAIGLNLKRLRHLADDALAQEVLTEVRTILTRTQEDVRTLSYLLHPPLLEEGGLVLALASLIQGLSSRMHISIDFDTDVPKARLPAEIEMTLYRVAQEALINVHKHAAATHAVVHFNRKDDWLVLEVEDDGVGISAQHARHIGSGVGIQGMRARLMELGGALNLSTLKHGTRIKAVVPLRHAVESN
jgi:signal transduction histidine kinase